MHVEFLIEDQSGEKAMKIIAPKILGSGNDFRTHSYRGIGHIPKGLKPKTDANKRVLLDQLPRLLNGYGRTPHIGAVVVICDLDDKNKEQFLIELKNILDACVKKPHTLFCLAIEEFEAWYLGDLNAVYKAFPRADKNILGSYINDSICGTWELLANAIYDGGKKALVKKGMMEVGKQKSIWAETISPHMNVEVNKSPSFQSMYADLKNAIINNQTDSGFSE
jgi:hypothetical protein